MIYKNKYELDKKHQILIHYSVYKKRNMSDEPSPMCVYADYICILTVHEHSLNSQKKIREIAIKNNLHLTVSLFKKRKTKEGNTPQPPRGAKHRHDGRAHDGPCHERSELCAWCRSEEHTAERATYAPSGQ